MSANEYQEHVLVKIAELEEKPATASHYFYFALTHDLEKQTICLASPFSKVARANCIFEIVNRADIHIENKIPHFFTIDENGIINTVSDDFISAIRKL